jgi:hypothetical protein
MDTHLAPVFFELLRPFPEYKAFPAGSRRKGRLRLDDFRDLKKEYQDISDILKKNLTPLRIN